MRLKVSETSVIGLDENDAPTTLFAVNDTNGIHVGWLRLPNYGPGYFVQVLGVTWQNAPGARYPTEKDARTNWTYARTRKRALEIIQEELAKRKQNASV